MVKWGGFFWSKGRKYKTSGERYRTRLSTNWNWKFGVDNPVEESDECWIIFGLYNQVCIQLSFHCRGTEWAKEQAWLCGTYQLHPDFCFVFAYFASLFGIPNTHPLLCMFYWFLHLTEAQNSSSTNKQKAKEQPSANLDSSEFILNFSWSVLEFSKVNTEGEKKFSFERHGDPENLHSSCIAANFQ